MVADSAGDVRAKRTALARGLALAPNQAPLLTEMAQLNARTGHWDEALLFATKATQFGEERWGALALRIVALAHLGKCREAGDLAGALQILAPPDVGEAVTRSWDSLRQSCTEAAAHAGPPSAATGGP
jgi:Tfp pilus assembly protein PilF